MEDMAVLARDENELILIYSSNTRVGKHTLSYLQGTKHRINTIDIAKTKVTGTQWAEIADDLGVKIGDLVDKRVLDEKTDYSNFDSDDWIKVLQNNNEVLTQPIAIKGKRVQQIENPPNIMEFFDVDSAGLKKTMHTDDPTIEPTTNGEDFK
jgi:arsenate reductase-like glutaredoxin family protein